uniref:Uncharacterized protein n=1 Tax=Onchocerca volvulus TaxID=6282 RepID=A0A8R1XYL5_ONCVO
MSNPCVIFVSNKQNSLRGRWRLPGAYNSSSKSFFSLLAIKIFIVQIKMLWKFGQFKQVVRKIGTLFLDDGFFFFF